MANLDQLGLPNGSTYNFKDNTQERSDHRHYGSDTIPLVHKLYESTSYYATSANDWATSTWYFMSIKPDDWYKPWRVKFKVHSYCPSYTNVNSYTWAEYTGRADAIAYANWNEKYDNAHYYTPYYPLKKAGFDAGYGHAVGISILYGTGYTTASYYRTFEIDYYECENCTVTILDTPVKWANWTGTGTTNYGSLGAPDACTRGLCETNDVNTVTENRIAYFSGKTGSKGIWNGSLFMEDSDGTYQAICTASDGTVTSSNRTTATTKIANTNGFKVLGTIWYCNTNYNANTNISGSSVVYSAISIFDSRYAFNTTLTANSLTPYKEVYLVGTINSNGLFYLDNPWWTQTPNDPTKVYVLVGACFDSTTSNCRVTLYEQNKWYRYSGSNLIEIANDARTVNGHTVAKDVPSDAKFTDTTYTLEADTTNKKVVLKANGITQNNVTVPYATIADHIINSTVRMTTADTAYSDAGLRYYLASSSMTTNKPPLGDGKILHMPWDTTAGWANELYMKHSDTSPRVMVRGQNGTTWGSWYPSGVFTQTTPTTGQVVVTDGTDGGIKASGYTIAKSVPSDAVFTDTQANWTQTTSTALDYIKNKPTLGTASAKDVPASGNASTAQVVMGNDTRLSDARTPTSHTHGNIANGGTITSTAVTPANTDYLLMSDASNSGKIERGVAIGTDTTKYLRNDGTWQVPSYPTVNNATLTIQKNGTNVQTFTANQSTNATANITVPTKTSELTNDSNFVTSDNAAPYEAKLRWGGQNFSGSYGCIDAAMVSELNANRFSFLKAAGITIEYTRDGGSTWIDYGATDVQKTGLFNPGQNFIIGKADSTNKATANGTNYQLRVTINTASASIYTGLKKIIIYCSTNGSAESKCQISGTLKPATTYTDITDPISINGWSGYNVIQVNFTAGNSFDGQYNNIRFLFTANGGNTSYNGLTISQILGFGGVGWSCPSTMAKTGHLYSYDASQNATFPANVTATKFIGPLQGNADTATKATQDESGNNIKATYANSFSISDHTITLKNKNGASLGTVTVPDNNTTYTFANGTNGFTVTPAGGTAQTVTVTPSITNNITGSGTTGYIAKFNGANTITNGPAFGSTTTTYLNNAGSWATPPDTKNTAGSTDTSSKIFLIGATSQAANPQTYSQDTAYVGTDGCLYSGGSKVITDISGKVSKTGDTMSGTLTISTGSASFGEGVRINLSSSGYSTLLLGAPSTSTAGTADGAFWIGTGSHANYVRKLYIGHNCSTASKTYFYASSSSQQSPNLRVGGDIFVTTGSADTGCKLRFSDTTQSLDFVFE